MKELDRIRAANLQKDLDSAIKGVLSQYGLTSRPSKIFYTPTAAKYTVEAALGGASTIREMKASVKSVTLPTNKGGFKIVSGGDSVEILNDLKSRVEPFFRSMTGKITRIQRTKAFVKDDRNGREYLWSLKVLAAREG